MRLHLELSDEMGEVLERLARSSGSTKADVLRRALGLMNVAKQAESTGTSLAIVKDNKIESRLVNI